MGEQVLNKPFTNKTGLNKLTKPFGHLVSRADQKSNHGLANGGQRLWSAQALSYLDRRTGHPVSSHPDRQTDPPWKTEDSLLTKQPGH